MIIIPAIDIIDGKCVRLTQGDYNNIQRYDGQPIDVALRYQDAGITHLHCVDLDGARAKHIVNYKVLETLCRQTSLHIDFGGGLQSHNDVRIAFECGAQQITGGSIAVKNRELFLSWMAEFGSTRIILGADARNEKIAVSGWQETTELSVVEFIENYVREGITHCICTDIAKDGMMQGASHELYKRIIEHIPTIQLIASGGVSTMHDIEQCANNAMHGVIIGKALYEGAITLSDLQTFIQQTGT
jgi:phosphoribosylformimino-5-aminoimidazole carboxamide ribotide isomerase